ncbi:MAG: pyridoxamine 5'-phosphate oxidase family protein [Promicromonosporaceae bacterium]|nr:pyridoxamine 5'-phosphate oxidase family protein [Promicromonosporaceae bacterium]
MTEVREQAERLYRKVNTFVLTCVGEDGYPLTKAVVPGKHRESLSELYFCTNTSSKFAAAITMNPKASVYFYSRGIKWQGCFLKGDMEIVTDLGVKEKYWQDRFKGAYPEQSFTDPDFCVLRFTPVSGRYYSNYHPVDFAV